MSKFKSKYTKLVAYLTVYWALAAIIVLGTTGGTKVVLACLLAVAPFVIEAIDALPVGTKSLLFGVHQFLWHPFTVWRAWRKLYGVNPTWRECVCIFVHDWGYWGCKSMDGIDGSNHTWLGAEIARRLLDGPDPEDAKYWQYGRGYNASPRILRDCDAREANSPGLKYYNLLRWHSRHLAKARGCAASKLCWPDKTSMLFDPEWFYLLRARLSGEIKEYRANAASGREAAMHVPLEESDLTWLRKLKSFLKTLAENQRALMVAEERIAANRYQPKMVGRGPVSTGAAILEYVKGIEPHYDPRINPRTKYRGRLREHPISSMAAGIMADKPAAPATGRWSSSVSNAGTGPVSEAPRNDLFADSAPGGKPVHDEAPKTEPSADSTSL